MSPSLVQELKAEKYLGTCTRNPWAIRNVQLHCPPSENLDHGAKPVPNGKVCTPFLFAEESRVRLGGEIRVNGHKFA